MNEIILYGAGGHSKVVRDILISKNIKVKLYFDGDETLHEFEGLKVYKYKSDNYSEIPVIISIGNNLNRKKVSQLIQHKFEMVVHESSIVSGFASIGNGTVVMQQSVIQSGTSIGKHCIINTSASVDHDCNIDDFVHISPNSTLCGDVYVGEGTHIGAGATVLPSVKIGKWATIGGGAVIIEDIPDYAVVVGNPGRVMKYNKDIYEK